MEDIDLNLPIQYFASSYRRFADGERLPRHATEGDIIMLATAGVLRFCTGGGEIELSLGEYFVQRSGTVISELVPSGGAEFFFIHFRARWREGEYTLPRRGKFDTESLSPLFSKLDALYHAEASYTAKCALFYTVLSELTPKRTDGVVGEIRAYLDREYVGFHSLVQLCELFHYSKNHIVNIFREKYGATPIEYVNELRLKRASYLLETTVLPIDKIAELVGFKHYSHFYRLFLRRFGISPAKWRADKKNKPV